MTEIFPKGSILQRRMVDELLGSLGYCHVGIYVGEEMIVHFDGEGSWGEDAIIRQCSLDEFERGFQVTIRAVPLEEAHARAVCKEARRLLRSRDNGFNHQYDLVTNNCEEFARHCFEIEYCGRSTFAPLSQVGSTALLLSLYGLRYLFFKKTRKNPFSVRNRQCVSFLECESRTWV